MQIQTPHSFSTKDGNIFVTFPSSLATCFLARIQNRRHRKGRFTRNWRAMALESGNAADNAPVPALRAARPATMNMKTLLGLALPPSLPKAALPRSDAVVFTMENFVWCRNVVVACRRSVLQQVAQQQRHAREARCKRQRSAADRPRFHVPPEDVPTEGAAAGAKRRWHQHLAHGGEPTLTTLAHCDLASAAALVVVAAHNVLRGATDVPEPRRAPPPPGPAPPAATGEWAPVAQDDAADPYGEASLAAAAGPAVPIPAASATLPPTDLSLDAASLDSLRQIHFLVHAGGGAWLWAALAAVDTPLDPDTERLLQDVLRRCCQHLKFVERHRPELLATAADGADAATPSCGSAARVGVELLGPGDVRALQGLVVVVGKYFRQANPSVLPL